MITAKWRSGKGFPVEIVSNIFQDAFRGAYLNNAFVPKWKKGDEAMAFPENSTEMMIPRPLERT
jgi:hypothetical protein